MSSSSPSSSSHQWKHEVFLSFRGADKRYSFITHLSERLKEKCISYFRDDDIDNTGMEIGDMIFRAIEHARIALVAFSEDYVNSKWCLNELVEILNCKRDHNLVVIPIFFIPTAEVKKWARDGKFEKALRNFGGEEKGNKEKDWKKALKDASEINGFNLLNHANRYVPVILTHFEAWYRNL